MSARRGTGTLGNRGEGLDTHTPEGRAACLLSHPVRRWALTHALRHGGVTSRDVALEWPALGATARVLTLRDLAAAGWLCERPGYRTGTGSLKVYIPADVSALHALHALLSDLLALSPTPEVPSHETES